MKIEIRITVRINRVYLVKGAEGPLHARRGIKIRMEIKVKIK